MEAVSTIRQNENPAGLDRATQDIRAGFKAVPRDLSPQDAVVKNHSTQEKNGGR